MHELSYEKTYMEYLHCVIDDPKNMKGGTDNR